MRVSGAGCFLVLRQPQSDDIDPAAADAARDEIDGVERQRRALLRRMIEMNVEIIRQRQLRLRFIHRHAVDLGQFAERVLAGDHEVAEQMRIGRRARRHVDKEAIQRLGLFRRRQQIDVIAGRDRIGLGGRENMLVADHQRRLRPGRDQAAPEIQAFRADGVADQLLLELAGQIELDPPRSAIGARQRHMQPARRRAPASSPAAAAK